MTTRTPTEPGTVPVLAILPRGPEADAVQRILSDEDVKVSFRDPSEGPRAWRNGESCRAVIVDESLEPAAVSEALEQGWIRSGAPLFVVSRRIPDRERYLAWLEAGAWDILKLPLEGVPLALRLRNILSGQREEESRPPRYAREALVRVADETLALARRQRRPFSCVVVAVGWPDGSGPAPALTERLADAAHRLVRRSDLIGIDRDMVFVLLPDTDRRGAGSFLQRLEDFLAERLKAWGVLATLNTAAAPAEGADSGRALLEVTAAGL